MSRLEEIKNDYAKANQYDNWTDFINDEAHWMVEKHMDNVCEIYAKECSQASLEKASEKAFIEPKGMMTRVDKESITNVENIVIL